MTGGFRRACEGLRTSVFIRDLVFIFASSARHQTDSVFTRSSRSVRPHHMLIFVCHESHHTVWTSIHNKGKPLIISWQNSPILLHIFTSARWCHLSYYIYWRLTGDESCSWRRGNFSHVIDLDTEHQFKEWQPVNRRLATPAQTHGNPQKALTELYPGGWLCASRSLKRTGPEGCAPIWN